MLLPEAKEILKKNGYRLVEDTDDSEGMSLKDKIANAEAFNDEDETADIMNKLQQRFDYDYGVGLKGYSVEGGADGEITIFNNYKELEHIVKVTFKDIYFITIVTRRPYRNDKTVKWSVDTTEACYDDIVSYIRNYRG